MKIALIGAGNMGEAILAGLHQKQGFLICEPRPDRRVYLQAKYRCTFGSLLDVVKRSEVVILAVKPQDFPVVLGELKDVSFKGKLIISLAAGITTKYIEKSFKTPVRVVRVMPNLPALVGDGVTGLTKGSRATPRDLATAKEIFAAVGSTVVVKEDMMDAVTAVSGSGPAYVFLFVESMMRAAGKLGFNEKEARGLVYKTLTGSAEMLMKSEDTAEALRIKVTSKGGTTQAATDVFMAKDMMGMFEAALKAARQRAKELSR